MVPLRDFDPKLMELLNEVKEGTTLDELIDAFIVTGLKKHDGNRTHTCAELGMVIRTFRNRILRISGRGYEVPKYKRPPHCAGRRHSRDTALIRELNR